MKGNGVYNKTQWNEQTAITAERLNKLESIYDALWEDLTVDSDEDSYGGDLARLLMPLIRDAGAHKLKVELRSEDLDPSDSSNQGRIYLIMDWSDFGGSGGSGTSGGSSPSGVGTMIFGTVNYTKNTNGTYEVSINYSIDFDEGITEWLIGLYRFNDNVDVEVFKEVKTAGTYTFVESNVPAGTYTYGLYFLDPADWYTANYDITLP
ncbi:hypothetical protein [Bacillus coahuilensis]|uniref:hypothetical protein n=1 Tax=Bacillus coahuilensis TaxID=408580 RepID=UPI0001850921|nr:hypothetical protein [Bacillus coahuilensis]